MVMRQKLETRHLQTQSRNATIEGHTLGTNGRATREIRATLPETILGNLIAPRDEIVPETVITETLDLEIGRGQTGLADLMIGTETAETDRLIIAIAVDTTPWITTTPGTTGLVPTRPVERGRDHGTGTLRILANRAGVDAVTTRTTRGRRVATTKIEIEGGPDHGNEGKMLTEVGRLPNQSDRIPPNMHSDIGPD